MYTSNKSFIYMHEQNIAADKAKQCLTLAVSMKVKLGYGHTSVKGQLCAAVSCPLTDDYVLRLVIC